MSFGSEVMSRLWLLLRWLGVLALCFAAGAAGVVMVAAVVYGLGLVEARYLAIIEGFQILISGVLAILAAAVALVGAMGSASMQAVAIQRDRERQIAFEKKRDEEAKERESLAFAMSLRVYAFSITFKLRNYIKSLRAERGSSGALSALNWYLREKPLFLAAPSQLSDWRNISLLESDVAISILALFITMEHNVQWTLRVENHLIDPHKHSVNEELYEKRAELIYGTLIENLEAFLETVEELAAYMNRYLSDRGLLLPEFLQSGEGVEPRDQPPFA